MRKSLAHLLLLGALVGALPAQADFVDACRRGLLQVYYWAKPPASEIPEHHRIAMARGFRTRHSEVAFVNALTNGSDPSRAFQEFLDELPAQSQARYREAWTQAKIDSGEVHFKNGRLKGVEFLRKGSEGVYFAPGSQPGKVRVLLLCSDIEDLLYPRETLRRYLPGNFSLGRIESQGEIDIDYTRPRGDDEHAPLHLFSAEIAIK